MKVHLQVVLTLAVALAAAALVAAGCGGDDKPDYCSNVSDLQQSVDDLKSVQVDSAVVSTLQTDVQKVQSNANAVVSSAKTGLPEPDQRAAVIRLESFHLDQAAARRPRRVGRCSTLTPQVNSVVTAAQGLSSATSSACD